MLVVHSARMEVVVAVRVLRLMEYTYPDLDTAYADMERWQIQGGSWQPRKGITIRSSVLLNPTPVEIPTPIEEMSVYAVEEPTNGQV